MKILFLIFSFNTGGIERLLIDMCNTMSRADQTVTLCIINKDYEAALLKELNPDVHILCLDRPMGSRNKLSYMLKLARMIRRERYDILHCQGLNCVIFSVLAKLYFPHVKILNTVHDVNNFPRYTRLQVFMHNTLCTHIIAISKTVEQEILARGTDPRMVTTIYNAIDTKRFCLCGHPHIQNQEARSIHSDEPIVIGNVARIIPAKKGQMVLLEAVSRLKDSFPNIHCYFAGGIVLHGEAQYEELQNYIRSNHLEKFVTFLGSVNDIPAFLATLDLFVLPSFYEGFGIALIEALATGIPCVASNLDGPAEIIDSPGMGLLCSPGNAEELAGCISDVIQNYEKYVPSAISKKISDRYSIDTLTAQHLDLYRKCHAKSRKPINS